MSTDLTGIENELQAANAAAKLATSHAAEWKESKAIKAGSSLAEELDAHLTALLARLEAEKAAEVGRIGKQLQRMKLEDRQRQLQAEIAANEERLKVLN